MGYPTDQDFEEARRHRAPPGYGRTNSQIRFSYVESDVEVIKALRFKPSSKPWPKGVVHTRTALRPDGTPFYLKTKYVLGMCYQRRPLCWFPLNAGDWIIFERGQAIKTVSNKEFRKKYKRV